MNIIKNFKNDLLSRKELLVEMESVKNPTFEEASAKLSEKLKADGSLLVVQGIRGNFGSNKFHVSALLYNSSEAKEKIERKLKVKKVAGGAS